MFSGLNMTNQACTLNETNSVLKQHHFNVVFIYLFRELLYPCLSENLVSSFLSCCALIQFCFLDNAGFLQ